MVWLFSLNLDPQRLLGSFCKRNGLGIGTTGDFAFFDDIKENCQRISALVLDGDQFLMADLESILKGIEVFTRPNLFEGQVVFVSAKKRKLAALKRRKYTATRPTPRSLNPILYRALRA